MDSTISSQNSDQSSPYSSQPSAQSWPEAYQPVLKVVGLGGGGCNAISRMMDLGLNGVEFIAANTDYQVLRDNPAPVKIQLGPQLTRGFGAGGDPTIGRAAAKESAKEITKALEGADMVFLTAGMGGGTGTGAIPIAAEISRSLGIVTIAVVTTPFSFELGRRKNNAYEGLSLLRKHTNTLITIPNDRLLYVVPKGQPLTVAFHMADDVLRQAVQGITELITEPGLINVDFAHVRRMMQNGGGAYMSIGQGQGENKTLVAIEQALHHPLLESVPVDQATGMIINFTGGADLTLFEVQEAVNSLQSQSNPEAEIILGVNNDDRLADRVQVILVITGIGATTLEAAMAKPLKPERLVRPIETPSEINREPATEFSTPAYKAEEMVPVLDVNNLDIPAFMRKKMRVNG